MSDQQPPTPPEPGQQDAEVSPADAAGASPDRSGAAEDPRWTSRDQRRATVVFGSLFAGAGFGIAFAVIVYMIAHDNPAAFPNGGGGQVAVMLLIVAPLIALGFGMLLSGLLPDDVPRQADPAKTETAEPGD